MLYIIRGLPGGGKSTLATMIADVVHEADQYFIDSDGVYKWRPQWLREAHQECLDNTKVSLKAGMVVAVANTFVKLKDMKPYLDLPYTKTVIECHGGFKNTHDVPDAHVQKMKDNWEVYLK